MTNATDKQVNFIITLRAERNLKALTFEQIHSVTTKDAASAAIKALLAMPKAQVPAPIQTRTDMVDVPAGRYALQVDGADDEQIVTKFYKVDRPTEGRWAGFTFVHAQASDEFHPIRNRTERERILKAIANDPEGASKRYGHELGHCGVCGRTLTDEQSREDGIGPICKDKMGW
jgi:hypothetical protein